MTATQPTMRCMFRFSLREMLLLVAACGCVLAFLFSAAHRQRRAVDAIRSLGGSVIYRTGDGEGVRLAATEEMSSWQRRLFGDRVGRVTEIDLSNSRVTDADLNRLTTFTEVRVLDLSQTQIDGSGLAVLQTMPSLRELDLASTAITDGALVHLEDLQNLEALRLDLTRITGPGLPALRSLPRLKNLRLAGTRIDDASLAQLADLKNLEELYLNGTNVSDAGLVHLRRCANLRRLSLENTRVSAPALAQLSGLSLLEEIKLTGLDLTLNDVADVNVLREKEQYVTRSRVVNDKQLLDAILQAWRERQKRAASFDVTSIGTYTRNGATEDVRQRFAADSQGRWRRRYRRSAAIDDFHSTDEAFDGALSQIVHSDSDDEHANASESPADPMDWRNFSSIPIAIAFRPLDHLFLEKEVAVTHDVEIIDGYECVVMYHGEGKIWVDPSRDHLPLRLSFIFRGATSGQYDIAFRKDDDAGWVPAGWTHSSFRQNGKLSQQEEIRVTRCTLNEPPSADLFQLEYPAGTRVTVPSTRKTYTVLPDGSRKLVERLQ